MPWSNQSARRASLPADWPKRRARTWRAAGGRCQWTSHGERCQWTGRLNGDGGQCDHINDRLNHDNLQWLCPHHHKQKTQREATAARPTRRRRPEPHPGLRQNSEVQHQ